MKIQRRRLAIAATLSAAVPAIGRSEASSSTATRVRTAPWPLSIDASKRYLVDRDARPFFIHGDTPWSIGVQLSRAQITAYLDDRQRKGFTAILFNAIEHKFSSQSPAWKSVEGVSPFDPYHDFSARVEDYWGTIDHVVSQANHRGIVCVINPAYLGYSGGDQGWTSELLAATPSTLHDYGAWLASRYRTAGIIWCMGGDYDGASHAGLLARQWHIADGIRAVDQAAIITAHGKRGQSAYSVWHRFLTVGLNLNNIYTNGTEFAFAAAEYSRQGSLPYFLIEGYYDGDRASAADCRRQAYASVLSGACGHMFGNTPIWGFGEPNANGGRGAVDALATSMSTIATLQMAHVKGLFAAYPWWRLQPRTGVSLVTTSLGTGLNRICPALANDGSFAMVWTTGSSFSVDMAALAPSRVRALWYDTITGGYSLVNGSPFRNTGIRPFSAPGERVLVLDAG